MIGHDYVKVIKNENIKSSNVFKLVKDILNFRNNNKFNEYFKDSNGNVFKVISVKDLSLFSKSLKGDK